MENETQLPPPQPPRARQLWLGIGLGAIPLVLALITIGSLANSNAAGVLFIISLLLYCAVLIAAIVCMIIKNVRYVGYGLLIMVCATPIIAAVACVVLLTALSPHS